MLRKRVAAGICALIMLTLTGCGGATGEAMASLLGPAPSWYDSDVGELVPKDKEIRLQDDFAAAVNQDFLKTSDFSDGGIFGTMKNLYETLDEMLSGDLSGTKAGDELGKYYELMKDDALRKESGYSSIKQFTDDIASISTTEELYRYICDPVRNPLGSAVITAHDGLRSEADPSRQIVTLIPSETSLDGTLYTKMTAATYEYKLINDKLITYLLSNMGYDEKSIKRILSNCYAAEKFIAVHNETEDGSEEEDMTFDRSEISEMAKGYPIREYLDSLGYDRLNDFVPCQEILKTADGYCRAHPENVRDYILCCYLRSLYICLDEESLNEIEELTKPLTYIKPMIEPFDEKTTKNIDRIKTYITGTALGPACAEIYCEKYITDEARTRLTDMTNTFIDEFENIISEEEWMSEEGKQEAINKLQSMQLHILDMDWDMIDYEQLNIVSKADGGNFVKAYAEVKRFENAITAQRLSDRFDRTKWDSRYLEINTLETNSFYSPEHNAIYILAGIAIDSLYYDGISDEELFGGIGWVVGHEITHGFDKNGVNYDKEGLKNTWLPDEDAAKFADMTENVGTYFSTMHPYDNCGLYDGNRVAAEAIADMGGLRLGLAAAKNIKDFDYDLYFKTCARTWQVNRSLEDEKAYFSVDEHPLAYLRVNCTLTQYEEFYETYGIKEGDGMYTEPDKRVKIW